ncbi:MAG: hypothetical protein K0R66_428 [Gammaproteobacteria bacterium]|jgi:hypothetical protein|nr:hypothetical protein [Gammaproteobacteria bacterium]
MLGLNLGDTSWLKKALDLISSEASTNEIAAFNSLIQVLSAYSLIAKQREASNEQKAFAKYCEKIISHANVEPGILLEALEEFFQGNELFESEELVYEVYFICKKMSELAAAASLELPQFVDQIQRGDILPEPKQFIRPTASTEMPIGEVLAALKMPEARPERSKSTACSLN